MHKFLPFIATSILLLTACSTSQENGHLGEQHVDTTAAQNDKTNITHNHLSGDLQEFTTAAHILPNFLHDKPEDLRLVYQIAGQATDILHGCLVIVVVAMLQVMKVI